MNTSKPFPNAATTWNKRFEHPGYLFGTEPNVYLKAQAAHYPKSGRALWWDKPARSLESMKETAVARVPNKAYYYDAN